MTYRVKKLLALLGFSFTLLLLVTVALANQTVASKNNPVLAQEGDTVLGGAIYTSYCAVCHGDEGEGIEGQYPPLKTHTAYIYTRTNTMDYMIQVLLYGLEGEIEALIVPKDFQGSEAVFGTFNDTHPAFYNLPDEALAGVLTYILEAWDNTQYFSIQPTVSRQQVRAQRGLDLTPQDVWELRKKLNR